MEVHARVLIVMWGFNTAAIGWCRRLSSACLGGSLQNFHCWQPTPHIKARWVVGIARFGVCGGGLRISSGPTDHMCSIFWRVCDGVRWRVESCAGCGMAQVAQPSCWLTGAWFVMVQGHCKALLLSIERLLGVLRVERLALPAAEGAEGIWLNKFGFRRMAEGQVCI